MQNSQFSLLTQANFSTFSLNSKKDNKKESQPVEIQQSNFDLIEDKSKDRSKNDVNLTDTSSNNSCCDLEINNENNSDDNAQDIDANMSDANSYTLACSNKKETKLIESKIPFDHLSTKKAKTFEMDTSISSIHSDKHFFKEKNAKLQLLENGATKDTFKADDIIVNKPPYIYKINRDVNIEFLPSKKLSLHYEDEKKFDSLDNHLIKNRQDDCERSDCNQCRRYSAADAVAPSVKIFQSKKVDPSDALNFNRDSLDNNTGVTTSIIKKNSNLKKSNSNFLNKPRLGVEKVKFSDVEFRHLINDKSIETEQSTDDKTIGFDLDSKKIFEPLENIKPKQQSLTPRNIKRKKLASIDQLQYDKLCSLQQLRQTSSPPASMQPSLIPSHKPRRLKYSNTLSILDLERMRTRSIGREFNPQAFYFVDDYADVVNSKRNKDHLLKKGSQTLTDDGPLKFYSRCPTSEYDLKYYNRKYDESSTDSDLDYYDYYQPYVYGVHHRQNYREMLIRPSNHRNHHRHRLLCQAYQNEPHCFHHRNIRLSNKKNFDPKAEKHFNSPNFKNFLIDQSNIQQNTSKSLTHHKVKELNPNISISSNSLYSSFKQRDVQLNSKMNNQLNNDKNLKYNFQSNQYLDKDLLLSQPQPQPQLHPQQSQQQQLHLHQNHNYRQIQNNNYSMFDQNEKQFSSNYKYMQPIQNNAQTSTSIQNQTIDFRNSQNLITNSDYQQFHRQQLAPNRAKFASANEKHPFPPIYNPQQHLNSEINSNQTENIIDQSVAFNKSNQLQFPIKSNIINIKPASNAQINRLLTEENAKVLSFIRTENKYNELLAENASFMDSPIHLLMNHHNNQRLMKQKKHQNELNKTLLNSQINLDENTNNQNTSETSKIGDGLGIISQKEVTKDMVLNPNFSEDKILEKPSLKKRKKFNSKRFKLMKLTMQRYLALIITSIITISSTYSLEILSCLIRDSNYHLMFFKLSSCLVSFVFVLVISFRNSNDSECDNTLKNKKSSPYNTHDMPHIDLISNTKPVPTQYYNLFMNENIFDQQIEDDDELNCFNESIQHSESKNFKDDSGQSSLLIEKNESDAYLNPESRLSTNQKQLLKFLHQDKLKSNFYMLIISVLLIHFWIIGTYLFSYIFSSASFTHLISNYKRNESFESIKKFIEIFLACIGGIGAALFFKNIIFGLFEISMYDKIRRIKKFIEFNLSTTCQSNKNQSELRTQSSSNIKENGTYYKSEQFIIIDRYQKSVFSFFVLIQLSFILAATLIFYIVYINGEKSINKIFSHVCIFSISNVTRFQFCPSFLVKNNLNIWKNEIVQNKITHFTLESPTTNSINKIQLGNLVEKPETNQTHHPTSALSDVYLLLISISLINFFICLVIPLLLIKSNRQSKKLCKEGSFVQKSDNLDSINESTSLNKIDNKLEKNTDEEFAGFIAPKSTFVPQLRTTQKLNKLPLLHLMMPLVFFQGLMRTIFFNELNKWYAGCLNGSKHLSKLLTYYGLSSFLSILFFALLIICCHLKRNFTLIVLLFYWDPSNSSDFKSYNIDYIFFVCFAICDNLWLAHNIKLLLSKSKDLDKSPCAILVYAYSIFNFGSFVGYLSSTYMCFITKLYFTFLLLIIFTLIHLLSELGFYLCNKKQK